MFSQVCVWPGIIIGDENIEDFIQFILSKFDVRVKYIEEIKTLPDWNKPGTGGRNDAFFYVHNEDLAKFAVSRFTLGVRWVEDVLDNEKRLNKELGAPEEYSIYPARVANYRTW